MAQELVVDSKTKIVKPDILTLYGVPETYGVPEMLNQISEQEKENVLSNITCTPVLLDALNKLGNNDEFSVEIPAELREILKSGKATFDKSTKNIGGLTPNIRIKGEAGIKGQATIVQRAGSQNVSQSLSNLALITVIQSLNEKLDVIKECIEEIKQGQENDRIAAIVGPFSGFVQLYSTSKTSEDLNSVIPVAYLEMQKGLTALHLQIKDIGEKLRNAPANHWQAFWKAVTHPLRNESERYQKYYKQYIRCIQLYNRLILLSDIVLYIGGKYKVFEQNHKPMADYCDSYIDSSFQKKMEYLMNGKTQGLETILEYNKRLKFALSNTLTEAVRIECKSNDIKRLNTNENGSKESRQNR